MNKTIIFKKCLFACLFLMTSIGIAQQKLSKVSQSIKVDKDVTIDLNTSYCNIVFDTWNKNVVEIEAYIEGDKLSQEDLEAALKDWEVDIDASVSLVSVSTKNHAAHTWSYKYGEGDGEAVNAVINELKLELADIPEMNFNFEMVHMPDLPPMPDLPELPKGINKIHFDYEAYKRDGEAYLEKWTNNFESHLGADYEKKMEAWGEKFGKEWGEKYGKEMEAWAKNFDGEWEEKFGKQMAQWGENFALQMERKAKHIEAHKERMKESEKLANERAKLADERRVKIKKMVSGKSNVKVKKTLIIKMPKDVKLKVNVRHGELEFASNIDNLKADLSHTKFTAQRINGSLTSINASYSPISVSHWNLGALNLNYVKDAKIDQVSHLVLTSNASNINIQNLIGNAIIDGNIGELKILKIDDSFTNLNIVLENSDAFIALPKVDHNFQFMGNRSQFSHPKKRSKDMVSSYAAGNLEASKTIVVNAKYSHVVMQ